MRILHLLSQVELTGAEVYAQTLVNEQTRSGHQVFVISDKIHVQLPVDWISMKISTSSFFQRMKNILFLRRWLKEKNIEVIHCHSRAACRHAYWARIGLKTAMLTTLHGRQHFSWSKRLKDLYGEYLLAVCENVKISQQLQFKTPAWKIKTSANPVSDLSFSEGLVEQKKLLIAGRSTGPKGRRIEQIVTECLPEVFAKFPDLVVDIVAGPQKAWSESFLSFLDKHKSKIQLKEHVPSLSTELAKYQAVIGSGRIAIETLLSGIPCFAMGEYEYAGLVTQNNFDLAVQSNFGDMGAEIKEHPLKPADITQDLIQFFSRELPSRDERIGLRQKAHEHFHPEKVFNEVHDLYKAAIFKRRVPRGIPILMYHKIPDQELQTRHRIFVTKENFEKHLQFFKSQGFTTLQFKELAEFWNQKKDYSQFPKKPLVLTFDDGYIDNLTNAEPLLRKYNMNATLFLLADHSITENTWDADTGEAPSPLMSLEQKKQLDQKIFEIGSHGYHHLHLNQVPVNEVKKELKTSKELLEKDFGAPVTVFAYPFGSVNEQLPKLAREAGYQFAVNTDQGGLHLADAPCSLFRANIFPEETKSTLKKKTSWWYRRYFHLKRGH